MHRYDWGAPRGGWPSFGPDGRVIRDDDVEPVRCPSCGEVVATGSPGVDVRFGEAGPGEVSVDGEVVHVCGEAAEEGAAR